MNGISLTGSSLLGSTSTQPSSTRITESTLQRQISQSATEALFEFITDEGDTVTISAQSNMESSFSSYDANGQLTDGSFSTSASTHEFFSSREITMTVDGELSDDEREDIRDILNSIGDNLEGLLKQDGEGDQAASLLQSLNELDTISSFNVSINASSSTQIDQVITMNRTDSDESTGKRKAHAHGHRNHHPHMDKMLRKMIKSFDKFEKYVAKHSEKLPQFMNHLMEKLGKRPEMGTDRLDLAGKIIDRMSERLNARIAEVTQPDDLQQPLMPITTDPTPVDSMTPSVPAVTTPVDQPDSKDGQLIDDQSTDVPTVDNDQTAPIDASSYQLQVSRAMSVEYLFQASASFQLYEPAVELLA